MVMVMLILHLFISFHVMCNWDYSNWDVDCINDVDSHVLIYLADYLCRVWATIYKAEKQGE